MFYTNCSTAGLFNELCLALANHDPSYFKRVMSVWGKKFPAARLQTQSFAAPPRSLSRRPLPNLKATKSCSPADFPFFGSKGLDQLSQYVWQKQIFP
jgi:hypothetical protein